MTAPRVPAERRAAVLAEIGALLGSALDHERALSRLVRLAVPVLGDLCAIDLVQNKDELHRAACAHVDTTKEALVYEIRARHGFNRHGGARGAGRHSDASAGARRPRHRG
mgnify:CR=1 FL=1